MATRFWPEAIPKARDPSGNFPFAQNYLNVAKVYHETSPRGRKYNVEVSYEFGNDHSTPFWPRGYLRVDQEILDYPKIGGYFTLSPQGMVRTLIQSYLHHVHATVSVVNAKDFLDEYAENGGRKINMLLLWGMFPVLISARQSMPISGNTLIASITFRTRY